jgi:hypothetical protein
MNYQYWYAAAYTNEMLMDTARPIEVDARQVSSPTVMGKLVLFDRVKHESDPYLGDISIAGRTDYLTHVTSAGLNVPKYLADHQRVDGFICPVWEKLLSSSGESPGSVV